MTDAFKAHMVKRGIVSKKVTVAKNGVDFSLYKKSPHGSRDLLRELGLEGKFVASYFGTHGMAHHLETVLEAVRELTGVEGHCISSCRRRGRTESACDKAG